MTMCLYNVRMVDIQEGSRSAEGEGNVRGNISKKLVRRLIWIFVALVSILIWIPQIDGLITKDLAAISECVLLDDAWDVTIDGKTYQNVLLTDFHFPAVRKGEQIAMERMLPSDWGLVGGVLRF